MGFQPEEKRKRTPRPSASGAKLNRNFTSEDGLASVVSRATDIYILAAALAEAQKRNKRRLVFRSKYAALMAFGLSDFKQDYDALTHALDLWRDNRFEFAAFYDRQGRKKPGYIKSKAAATAARKKFKEQLHQRRRFLRVWRFNDKGKKLIIEFAQDFWEANGPEHFCVVNIIALKKLLVYRHAPLLLLYLLVTSWGYKTGWRAKSIAAHIGLKERRPKRLRDGLGRMIRQIKQATGLPLEYYVKENGIVVITQPWKSKKIPESPPDRWGETKSRVDERQEAHEYDLADD